MRQDPEQRYRYARVIGNLASIPLLFGAGAMIGFYIGQWLDRRFHTTPWLASGFVGLGLASAVRSTIQMIRRARKDLDQL